MQRGWHVSTQRTHALSNDRNTIGLVTYLLDSGGVAVFDPQMFTWWSADEWREHVFAPGRPLPRTHVKILFSEDNEGEWFHTRGMRKFGRPDLSIHGVPAKYRDAIIDLCNRFIEFQSFGGIIGEDEEIRIASLPAGMTCKHRGSLDCRFSRSIEPDFHGAQSRLRVLNARLHAAEHHGTGLPLRENSAQSSVQINMLGTEVMVVGRFANTAGQQYQSLALVDTMTGRSSLVNLQINAALSVRDDQLVTALAVSNGRVLMGGNFEGLGSVPRGSLSMITPDGIFEDGFGH